MSTELKLELPLSNNKEKVVLKQKVIQLSSGEKYYSHQVDWELKSNTEVKETGTFRGVISEHKHNKLDKKAVKEIFDRLTEMKNKVKQKV